MAKNLGVQACWREDLDTGFPNLNAIPSVFVKFNQCLVTFSLSLCLSILTLASEHYSHQRSLHNKAVPGSLYVLSASCFIALPDHYFALCHSRSFLVLRNSCSQRILCPFSHSRSQPHLFVPSNSCSQLWSLSASFSLARKLLPRAFSRAMPCQNRFGFASSLSLSCLFSCPPQLSFPAVPEPAWLHFLPYYIICS